MQSENLSAPLLLLERQQQQSCCNNTTLCSCETRCCDVNVGKNYDSSSSSSSSSSYMLVGRSNIVLSSAFYLLLLLQFQQSSLFSSWMTLIASLGVYVTSHQLYLGMILSKVRDNKDTLTLLLILPDLLMVIASYMILFRYTMPAYELMVFGVFVMISTTAAVNIFYRNDATASCAATLAVNKDENYVINRLDKDSIDSFISATIV